jgi:WD40 repeat protein
LELCNGWLRAWILFRAVSRVRTTSSAADRYDAFISYSHAVDGKLAPAIRNGLHRFAKPWYRRRALRVFYDQASLQANPGLWSAIETALGRAGAFVYLASPTAAQSRWVKREIEFWRTRRPDSPIHIVLTAGHITWSDASRDFDWTNTDAVPRALSGAYREEPLWLDLRWARSVDQVSLRHPRFRDTVATLSATLQNRNKDDLLGDDVRLWKRARRLAITAISLLVVLTVAASILGIVAVQQRNAASRQAEIATSRQLVAESDSLRTSQPDVSMLVAVEAMHITADPTARASLVRTLVDTPLSAVLTGHRRGVSGVAVTDDDRTLVTADTDGIAFLYDLASRTKVGEVRPPALAEGVADGVAVAPEGRILATVGDDVSLWDISDRTAPVLLSSVPGPDVHSVAFSPDGHTLVVGQAAKDSGLVGLWDVGDPRHPHQLGSLPLPGFVEGLSVGGGKYLAVADSVGKVTLVDIADPARPRVLSQFAHGSGASESGVAFSADGALLATAGPSGSAVLWRNTGGKLDRVASLIGHAAPIFEIAFAGAGEVVTASADGTAIVWDVTNPVQPVRSATLSGHIGPVATVTVAPDGQIITGGNDDTVRVWRGAAIGPHRISTLGTTTPTQIRVLAGSATLAMTTTESIQLPGSALYGQAFTISFWSLRRPGQPERLSSLTFNTGYTSGDPTAISGDGTMLAALTVDPGRGSNSSVKLWDLSDPAHPRLRSQVSGLEPQTESVQLDLHGHLVATTYYDRTFDEHVIWWDVSGSGAPRRLAGEPTDVLIGAINRSGTVAAATDYTTRLYRLGDGAPKWQANLSVHREGPAQIAFGGDRIYVATGPDQTVEAWDITNPSQPNLLATIPFTFGVYQIAVSPDGKLLTVIAPDGTAGVWDVGGPTAAVRMATLTGFANVFTETLVAFTDDGRDLITMTDGPTEMWDLSELADIASDPVKRACVIAGPALSRADWQQLIPDRPYRQSCP